MNTAIERLLDCIGEIDDLFLEEAETADIVCIRRTKRKRIVKYSAAAGLAASFGIAVTYFVLRSRRAAAAR